MPGCLRRNSTPCLISSAMSSKLTIASLLSERGFMPSTMKPRLASSLVLIIFIKFDVRWMARKATVGAGPLSGA